MRTILFAVALVLAQTAFAGEEGKEPFYMSGWQPIFELDPAAAWSSLFMAGMHAVACEGQAVEEYLHAAELFDPRNEELAATRLKLRGILDADSKRHVAIAQRYEAEINYVLTHPEVVEIGSDYVARLTIAVQREYRDAVECDPTEESAQKGNKKFKAKETRDESRNR